MFYLADKEIFPNELAFADAVTSAENAMPGGFGAAFGKMLLSLALLIALLVATLWLLKRLIHNKMQRGSAADSIHLIEKKMISPKTVVYLVEVEGEKILLAESQLEIRRLKEWKEKES